MVTLAAEGAVCVLADAVGPTDGLIDTLINICEARAHREHIECISDDALLLMNKS